MMRGGLFLMPVNYWRRPPWLLCQRLIGTTNVPFLVLCWERDRWCNHRVNGEAVMWPLLDRTPLSHRNVPLAPLVKPGFVLTGMEIRKVVWAAGRGRTTGMKPRKPGWLQWSNWYTGCGDGAKGNPGSEAAKDKSNNWMVSRCEPDRSILIGVSCITLTQ